MALRHTAECDLGVKIIMGTAVNSGASLWCLGGVWAPKPALPHNLCKDDNPQEAREARNGSIV